MKAMHKSNEIIYRADRGGDLTELAASLENKRCLGETISYNGEQRLIKHVQPLTAFRMRGHVPIAQVTTAVTVQLHE